MLTASFVLAHFTFEFVLVSEQISSACSPVNPISNIMNLLILFVCFEFVSTSGVFQVMNGFEFVRRHGLMRCRNTHEVRLVSLSPTCRNS